MYLGEFFWKIGPILNESLQSSQDRVLSDTWHRWIWSSLSTSQSGISWHSWWVHFLASAAQSHTAPHRQYSPDAFSLEVGSGSASPCVFPSWTQHWSDFVPLMLWNSEDLILLLHFFSGKVAMRSHIPDPKNGKIFACTTSYFFFCARHWSTKSTPPICVLYKATEKGRGISIKVDSVFFHLVALSSGCPAHVDAIWIKDLSSQRVTVMLSAV